jgi:membrane-associated protein
MLMTTALSAAGPVAALGPDFLDPQHLIDSFGTWVLLGIMAIVFVEVGLLFPILPGDSLLFTAGALVAQDNLEIKISIGALVAILILTAYAGTQTGYLIGRTLGPKVFSKPDSRFFKQKYIDQTYAYFDKYGGRTLIVAQFIPFVRTYASVAAGVGKMPYRHFALFNAIGVILWAGGVTMLGYLLGNIAFIRDNIEALLVLVVLMSVVPVLIEVWRKRRHQKTGEITQEGRDLRYDEQAERDEVERKAFGA